MTKDSVLPAPPAGFMVQWLRAADGTRLRLLAWPEGERGAVLLLGGRTEFAELYFETVAELRARGFAVYLAEWRGQGRSDRGLADPHKGDVADFRLYQEDLAAVAAALPGPPPLVMACSMGGAIALRWLQDDCTRARAAVLVTPMLRIRLPTEWLSRLLAGAAVAGGLGPRYAPGTGPYRAQAEPFEGNRLTGDRLRHRRRAAWFEAEPGLVLGGPTWRWLAGAIGEGRLVRRPERLARLRRPVLLASAGADRVLDNSADAVAARHLPDCRHVVVPGARHCILLESDPLRAVFWREFDRFTAALPPA